VPVPTHGPYCQTWMYPTDCWYCGKPIHILQCTCGSVVLFDYPRPPWQEHDHTGGIGGSGYSHWQAVDVLRSLGVPIVQSVLDKIFPKAEQKQEAQKSASNNIKAVAPKFGVRRSLLAVVREFYQQTNRTERMKALGGLGTRLLKLPPGPVGQITLVNNGTQPNLSYTCILPSVLGLAKNAKNKMVFAEIEGRGVRGNSIWIVTDIRVI
jgi:hypothetical protein